MSAKSNTLFNDEIDHYFFNEPIANVGNAGGLLASTVAGVLYWNLYKTLPTKAGGGVIMTYSNYAEVTLARAAAGVNMTRTSQRIENNADIGFGQRDAGGAAEVSLGWGCSRSSGSTSPDWFSPHFAADSFVGVCDDSLLADHIIAPDNTVVDDDEIMFLPAGADGLPGVSQGTRYFVINRTADDFQVSDTMGGSVFALSNGSARCAKVVTISVTENIEPILGAQTVQIYY